jgi:hypothetical protein
MVNILNAQIDDFIEKLPMWQRNICIRMRRVIHEAEPGVEEVIKRDDRPYFVLNGNICAFQATKDHINVFIYDPIAPDPQHIINQGHENKTARSIQIYENSSIDEDAFRNLVHAVANNNRAGGWRKLKQQ